MPEKQVLKNLMLNLIYPAVLGTVMYGAVAATLEPLVGVLAGRTVTASADPNALLKACLLVITVAFYIADYLYIWFTRQFGWLFFAFDLVFLVTLYVSVYAIGLSAGPTTPPSLPLVVKCFLIFMGLYLVWDVIERSRSQNSRERRWYGRVLTWEGLSLLVLAGIFALGLYSPAVVVVTLSFITCAFWVLTLQKRYFFGDGDTASS
jgi:hypothetical protein